MGGAGLGHFRSTEAFLGQTPSFLPFRTEIVLVSGAIELAFALALVAWPARRRLAGQALAFFYVVIFPGNIYQAVAGTSSFGLDTPGKRIVRLFFQPVLVLAALWSTGWPRYDAEGDHEEARR
jgi:uncharacterized membrane protein